MGCPGFLECSFSSFKHWILHRFSMEVDENFHIFVIFVNAKQNKDKIWFKNLKSDKFLRKNDFVFSVKLKKSLIFERPLQHNGSISTVKSKLNVYLGGIKYTYVILPKYFRSIFVGSDLKFRHFLVEIRKRWCKLTVKRFRSEFLLGPKSF